MYILKDTESNHSYLSTYHVAINLIGYISLYNAFVKLYKQADKDKNLKSFMQFSNDAMLKDMAIELNELYKYTESIKPDLYDDYIKDNPDFTEFREFIKKLRNSMKLIPKQKRINDVLEKSKNQYPTNILKIPKNDIVYYCGYFLGQNLIFGSNLYFEYIFYKPLELCKKDDDLFKFTNSISSHLESFYKFFEKYIFKNSIDIPEIKLKDRKRFFQIYSQTTKFEKMLKKSKYNKSFIFIFMLLIEEISGLEIYLDYMIDLKKSIEDPILLYFFTQFVAIKYDEISDAIKWLIRNKTKFGNDSLVLGNQISKLNIFDKEVVDFARNLRNAHHHEEIEKYKIVLDKDEINVNLDFKDLYLLITHTDNWPCDFEHKLYEMLHDLHILVSFCRKNVGISY